MSEDRSKRLESAKDLTVYKLGHELAMKIFEMTKRFPSEEKYALTSQIRRSSRTYFAIVREIFRVLIERYPRKNCRASASLAGQRGQAERPPYNDVTPRVMA